LQSNRSELRELKEVNKGLRSELNRKEKALAEQAVMSIDVLSFAIEEPANNVKSGLARMFQLVDNDDGYDPSSLIREFRAFKSLADMQ
jgi:hypothetical protein